MQEFATGKFHVSPPGRAIRCGRLSGTSVLLLPKVVEEQCRLLALLSRPSMSALRPLPGVIRTLSPHRRRTGFDPIRTLDRSGANRSYAAGGPVNDSTASLLFRMCCATKSLTRNRAG